MAALTKMIVTVVFSSKHLTNTDIHGRDSMKDFVL